MLAADGVRLAWGDGGRPDGRPIVLLHGIAQSREVWRSLVEGPLGGAHRLVAVDLRGHGDSERPEDDGAYGSERLGADLDAVIEGLGLARPLVVAWSYGGVVLGAYLRRYGSARLGGILLAAAAVQVGKAARALFGPAMMSNARALISTDEAEYEAGARSFLRGCTAAPLAPGVFDRALEAMLRVPAHVRRPLLARSEDYLPELARCTAPIATIHGSLDAVVLPQMSELVASSAPGTRSDVLEGVGHIAWLESPDAFVAAVRALDRRR
jgi:pimeloyl-ACP methyl ester carboxylesterase